MRLKRRRHEHRTSFEALGLPLFSFCTIMFKECFQAKRQPVVLIQVERS